MNTNCICLVDQAFFNGPLDEVVAAAERVERPLPPESVQGRRTLRRRRGLVPHHPLSKSGECFSSRNSGPAELNPQLISGAGINSDIWLFQRSRLRRAVSALGPVRASLRAGPMLAPSNRYGNRREETEYTEYEARRPSAAASLGACPSCQNAPLVTQTLQCIFTSRRSAASAQQPIGNGTFAPWTVTYDYIAPNATGHPLVAAADSQRTPSGERANWSYLDFARLRPDPSETMR